MKNLPVGLQLYTVRDFAEKDFFGTLKKVKEIGYDYVELAGMYGLSPAYIKAAADEAGIKVVSAHVPMAELSANPEAAIDAVIAVGVKYVVIPYLDETLRPGAAGFEGCLAEIEKIGKVAAANGVKLLYHNHDFEFVKMPDGSFGLDYMYKRVPAEYLATELDTCWIKVAGEDPAAYVRKYAGRAPVVHLKDFKGQKSENMYELIGIAKKVKATEEFGFRPVGHGVQDFGPILAACLEAGSEYVIVEQDRSDDCTSIEAAAKSRQYLKSVGW
ncbi:MAG: sugar phosphate isomerase/epimerase [Clostridiales bacterium]|nr:sugar phosphate isomerase/epimerase [Clostridiales bacterium]